MPDHGKSNKKRNRVYKYGDPVSHCTYVNYVNADVPNTYEEAVNCNDYTEWQKATNEGFGKSKEECHLADG